MKSARRSGAPRHISDIGSGASWNIDIVTSEPLSNAQGGEYLNYNASGTVVGRIVGGDLTGGSRSPAVVRANSSSEIRYSSLFNTLAGATLTGNQFIVDDSFVEPHECELAQTSTLPTTTSTNPATDEPFHAPAFADAAAERLGLQPQS